MTNSGWIGVDLDGTLAEYDGWKGETHIGAPIPVMVERVKGWLAEGKTVKIFTARVCVTGRFSEESQRFADQEFADDQVKFIQDWCEEHIGQRLEVTCIKDFMMIELWDDRCVQVRINTGERVDQNSKALEALRAFANPENWCRFFNDDDGSVINGFEPIPYIEIEPWKFAQDALKE